MDEIVGAVGRRNNCAFCGVFRRQALERGAALVGANKLATGHNADDVAETVLMNFLRGDIARLGRCTAPGGGSSGGSGGGGGPISVPRIKPFLHCYEKEIVLYARHAKLDYVSTECKYSPGAYRGFAREFLKDLEATRSSVISDIIFSAQQWEAEEEEGGEAPGAHGDEGGGGGGEALAQAQQAPARACARCGFAASGELCQACLLLAGLAVGRPRLALTKAGATRAEVAAIMAIPSQPARNAEVGGAGPQPG
jgi:cytoplasmic tRNA 2-thiolation protein 1